MHFKHKWIIFRFCFYLPPAFGTSAVLNPKGVFLVEYFHIAQAEASFSTVWRRLSLVVAVLPQFDFYLIGRHCRGVVLMYEC